MKHSFRVVLVALMLAGAFTTAEAQLPQLTDYSPRGVLYSATPWDDSTLATRSLVELHLMRNWIYARAGNPFRKAWLRDFFEQQDWYRPAAAYDPARLSGADRMNLERIARQELSYSRLELIGHLSWLRDQYAMEETESGLWHIEGSLTAARLGVSFGIGDSTTEGWTPLADPRSWDRQLSLRDLQDLSRRDLRILRNILYARRGRPFAAPSLQEYFATLEWYEPDPAYTDTRLTAVDRRNIKLILDLERKLGGPMTESELGKLLDGA